MFIGAVGNVFTGKVVVLKLLQELSWQSMEGCVWIWGWSNHCRRWEQEGKGQKWIPEITKTLPSHHPHPFLSSLCLSHLFCLLNEWYILKVQNSWVKTRCMKNRYTSGAQLRSFYLPPPTTSVFWSLHTHFLRFLCLPSSLPGILCILCANICVYECHANFIVLKILRIWCSSSWGLGIGEAEGLGLGCSGCLRDIECHT